MGRHEHLSIDDAPTLESIRRPQGPQSTAREDDIRREILKSRAPVNENRRQLTPPASSCTEVFQQIEMSANESAKVPQSPQAKVTEAVEYNESQTIEDNRG